MSKERDKENECQFFKQIEIVGPVEKTKREKIFCRLESVITAVGQ
jgi:hypothetical protein